MPPFRDPYDHEQKLADLVSHYERVKRRAQRATVSAHRKMILLLACAIGLATWTGALMDWSQRLNAEQARTVAASVDGSSCEWQLHSVEGTAQNRLATIRWMSADLNEADEALAGCEADVDVLQNRIDALEDDLYDADIEQYEHSHEMLRVMTHEAGW